MSIETGKLTVSSDHTNCNLPRQTVTTVIYNAFNLWRAVLPAFFSFTLVPVNGSLRTAFGGIELNPK
jgi:hypothetical protein